MSESGVVTVLMTAPAASAEAIVHGLVDLRLVACGNVLPKGVSLYRWEGQVRRDEEAVVVLKTLRSLVPQVLQQAAEIHPYTVPELLVHDVVDGGAAYLDWVRRACGGAESQPGDAESQESGGAEPQEPA